MKPLPFLRLCRLLQEMSYKEWVMHLIDDVGSISFLARIPVRDARGKEPHLIFVKFHRILPDEGFNNPQAFVKWIFQKVVEFETHEAGEWFQFKKELVFDPHTRREAHA